MANLVINASEFDFLLLAFSTKSSILLTVDSPNFLVTFTFKTLSLLMHPLNTSSPFSTLLGTLSPVRASVLSIELPSTTTPSKGIFSPGLMSIISSILTSFGSTLICLSFLITFA